MFLTSLSASAGTLIECKNSTTGVTTYTLDTCNAGSVKAVPVAPLPVVDTSLPTDKIFASNSFWYTPIPENAPLATNSALLDAEFLRQEKAYYGNVEVNTSRYAAPVYTVGADVKPVKVGFNNCQHKPSADPAFMSMMSAVPIPSYAQESKGTDGEMAIYQPSTNSYWELWQAKKDASGNWLACWGGKISNISTNHGAFNSYYGTTATSLPFIGGQITAEELQRGEIKHAIGIAMVDIANWNVVSWPANRSDGWNPKNLPNRIAEGQRFRLDPTIDVNSLHMTKAGKTIAKAAQKYGFVVWDKAGSISIRAQNVLSYTALGKPNPYPALYEAKPTYAVFNGFPWNKLQFMPMNYGK